MDCKIWGWVCCTRTRENEIAEKENKCESSWLTAAWLTQLVEHRKGEWEGRGREEGRVGRERKGGRESGKGEEGRKGEWEGRGREEGRVGSC